MPEKAHVHVGHTHGLRLNVGRYYGDPKCVRVVPEYGGNIIQLRAEAGQDASLNHAWKLRALFSSPFTNTWVIAEEGKLDFP